VSRPWEAIAEELQRDERAEAADDRKQKCAGPESLPNDRPARGKQEGEAKQPEHLAQDRWLLSRGQLVYGVAGRPVVSRRVGAHGSDPPWVQEVA